MKSNTTYVTYCKSYPINYPHNGKFRNPESKLIVYSDKFLLSEIFRSRHDSPAPFSPNGFSGVWGNKGTWLLWTGQQENEDIKYLKLCLKQCSDKNSFGNCENDMMELKVFKRREAALEHHCKHKGRKNGGKRTLQIKALVVHATLFRLDVAKGSLTSSKDFGRLLTWITTCAELRHSCSLGDCVLGQKYKGTLTLIEQLVSNRKDHLQEWPITQNRGIIMFSYLVSHWGGLSKWRGESSDASFIWIRIGRERYIRNSLT